MKLTIGMATFDDFHGVAFTVQSLLLHHLPKCGAEYEVIVVDNNPGSAHGKATRDLCAKTTARYVPMVGQTGTTQPRERIFREATGDLVLCMDPHVLFALGSLRKLVEWYRENPTSLDLLSGPLIYDNLVDVVTHFNEHWSAEMEGQWNTDPRGIDPGNEPFDIPGQGLGVFSCRKAAWLGFNPHFRQFGGEELYIHRKFRKAGRRTLCLPFLRWWHRFGRPEGIAYPIQRYGKVRNYVLGHQELGMDVTPIYDHFVRTGVFPQREWDYLLADPVSHENPESPAGCNTCGGGSPAGGYGRPQPPADAITIDQIYAWAKNVPRDMEVHYDVMRSYAEKCSRITEFSKRRETTLTMLAGKPKVLISYNSEKDEIFDRYHAAVAAEKSIETFTTHLFDDDPMLVEPIERTDLLLIHAIHHGERLFKELLKHGGQVDRFIMFRSTAAFAEVSEDGHGPGLLPAIRNWMKMFPEWSVLHHSVEQYGLTVIGRLREDKPALPGKIEMAFNLAKAVAQHAADGFQKSTEEQIVGRLEKCSMCSQRVVDRCAACGCFIEPKAAMSVSECPLGYWDV